MSGVMSRPGDVGLGHGLEPDRLPDARHGRVEDAVRLHDLLAAGDAAVVLVGRVPGPQHDLLLRAPLQEPGDVVSERVVAAAMAPGLAAVDPDRALPVDRAEVKEEAAAAPGLGHLDRPPVPEGLVDADRLADARERRFDRERDQDLPVPGLGAAGLTARDGIVPEAVQVRPIRAGHLGPGIFGQGVGRADLGRPAGHDPVPGGLPLRGRLGFAGGERAGEHEERQNGGRGSLHGGTPIDALVDHPARVCQSI